MWWHYLVMIVGLYLLATSLYNIAMAGNRAGWIVNGISSAIGGAMIYYAYVGITTPAPLLPTALGGRRKWY
jgi:uncharacterized membrane protein